MARRRRKKRMFGSLSREHIREANSALSWAANAVDQAERAYRKSSCLEAGKEIDQAYLGIGKATAHLMSTTKSASQAADAWDWLHTVKTKLKRVDEQFEQTCVRKQPKR